MSKIGQISCYKNNNNDIIYNDEVIDTENNILKDYFPITKIGIWGPSGTSFKLNDGSIIELGAYGIYELDLTNIGYITKMTLHTIGEPNREGETPTVYIDFVYHREDLNNEFLW